MWTIISLNNIIALIKLLGVTVSESSQFRAILWLVPASKWRHGTETQITSVDHEALYSIAATTAGKVFDTAGSGVLEW